MSSLVETSVRVYLLYILPEFLALDGYSYDTKHTFSSNIETQANDCCRHIALTMAGLCRALSTNLCCNVAMQSANHNDNLEKRSEGGLENPPPQRRPDLAEHLGTTPANQRSTRPVPDAKKRPD